MAFSDALERLRAAILPGSDARRGGQLTNAIVSVRDLAQLLDDHERMDAQLRTAHFHANRPAYPPRADMMARVAADPGMWAGFRGERTMGRWIADAILAVERQAAPEELRRLYTRLRVVIDRFKKRDPVSASVVSEAAHEIIDQAQRVERLRRILARYGDRVPMAACHRTDWQQEIDEALEWAANNSEEDQSQ